MEYDSKTREILIEKAQELLDLFKRPDVNDLGYIRMKTKQIFNEIMSISSVTVVR